MRDARSQISRPPKRSVGRSAYSWGLSMGLPTRPVGITPPTSDEYWFLLGNRSRGGRQGYREAPTGKSTLPKALALSVGFNPEGDSRNFNFATRAAHAELHQCFRVAKTSSPCEPVAVLFVQQ